ncbi:MAG: DUF1648 domain-containing protein [Planctomycetota bacterium]
MNPKRLQALISGVLLLLIAFQVFQYYPKLPNIMPSKYNASGQPVSTMTKEAFFCVYVGTYLLLFLIFAGVGLFAHKVPISMINIPNRDYWFSEEHRAEANDRLGIMMLRFSNITSLFLIVLLQFIVDQILIGANFGTKFWVLIGAYFIFVVIWTFQFWIKFKKPTPV